MDKLINILINIGLSEKEAIIYSSILKIGTCSLSDISNVSGIKRTTLYGYLDLLLNKGFISKTIKSKRILYIADNPENILKNLDKKRDIFSKYLPEIIGIYTQANSKPNTIVYEQLSGINKVYKEISESLTPIYAIVSTKKFMSNIKLENRVHFLDNIKRHENKIYNLVENNAEGKKFKKEFSGDPMILKFLPKSIELSVDILIYQNKIAMVSFDNLNAIVIENKEISNCLKQIHKLLWSIY